MTCATHESLFTVYMGARMTQVMPLRFLEALLLGALLVLLSGCSEMRFANASDNGEDDDPREDVRMVNVVTDITSGSERLQRITSREASYAELRGLLKFSNMHIDMYRQGRCEGFTEAAKGTVYLSEQLAGNPPQKRGKNDVEFLDRVAHNVLSKDTPTTVISRLATNQLLWDATEKKFRGKTPYSMTMRVPGKQAMRMLGDRFEVTQDLRTWWVVGGTVTSEMQGDTRKNTLAAGDHLAEFVETSQPSVTPVPRNDIDVPDVVPMPQIRQRNTTNSLMPSLAIPL